MLQYYCKNSFNLENFLKGSCHLTGVPRPHSEKCCISPEVCRWTNKVKHASRPEHQLRRDAVDQLSFTLGLTVELMTIPEASLKC